MPASDFNIGGVEGQIAALNTQMENKVTYYAYDEFPSGVMQKTYTLSYNHVYLVTVTGNAAWGDTSTVAIVCPGTNGELITLLQTGRHTVSISGTTLTIGKSNYGGAYISVIALA